MVPIRRIISSNQFAGWLDQIVVSGANFAVLLIVARWTSVAHVGYYAIGYSNLALAMTVQDSLVTRPYAIQFFKPSGRPETHAFASLAFGLLLSLLLAAALIIAAVLLQIWNGPGDSVFLALALAFALPFVLLREFVRRYSFAHLLMRQAIVVDVMTSTAVISLLAILEWNSWLTAFTALGALGLACGSCAGLWLALNRRCFHFSVSDMGTNIRQSMGLGKWLLTSQFALDLQTYAAHWITLLVGGAVATGIYSACLSIVALSNPFVFGYVNILTPKFVRALKDGGTTALRRQSMIDALFLALVMGAFALFIATFGHVIMAWMFPGEDYLQNINLVTILAFAAAAGAIGRPATAALSAAEKGRAIAFLSAGACVLGFVLVLILMMVWGLEAAVYGILATECLTSVAQWALFLHSVPAESERPGLSHMPRRSNPSATAVS